MRIISLASGKGGVGKTTIAGALGVVLAAFGKKTLVMDCNVTTPHLGLYVGIENTPITLNHVLTKRAHPHEALYKHTSGFDVIPSSIRLKDLEGIDVSEIYNVIKKDHKEVFEEYDYVLLDCAPGLGREAIAGIRAADEVIYITTPYLPPVMDVVKCNEIVKNLSIKPNGVVLNMVQKKRYELNPKYIANLVKLPIIASVPMDRAVLHSLNKRLPVTFYKHRSKASKSIAKVAEYIMSQDHDQKNIS
ncbi:MAG: AAA family ATPase [Candidatus Aenigmatarchaeota archaeon]